VVRAHLAPKSWTTRVAAVATLTCAAVLSAPCSATSSTDSGPVRLVVDETCRAPSPSTGNFCTIDGVLRGSGVDGADIVWQVTLFFNESWRIQFQAFSEGAVECQYPIRVKGSYRQPRATPVAFNTSAGFDLGLSPADVPKLNLTVKRVRIDPGQPLCG
jgi:hypothetical protein